MSPPAFRFSLLLPLFLGSGFSALVYQVLWQRQLGLVFGVTAYATSTVLAAFMAGLALGSWVAGKLSTRVARPLMAFGVCELLVGASALLTPMWLDAARVVYVAVAQAMPNSFAALTGARLLCSFLVLLVPTTLMGATLPLVLKSSLGHDVALGGRLATLYGVNTLGALMGTLLTGFWLIGAFGIRSSYTLAALVNTAVAIVAMVVGRRATAHAAQSDAREWPDPAVAAAPSSSSFSRAQRAALAVAALSGCASLALEVVWVRWLVLFLPATTYAFSTMLAVVLAGIAAGSVAAARVLRTPRPWLTWLAATEAGTGLAALGAALLLTRTFAAGWRTSATLQGSIVAMFPPAFMMGLALPIAIRVFASPAGGDREDPRLVGHIYAVNLLGSIIGALLGGFVLLPWLGSRQSLVAMSGLLLVAALIAWLARGPEAAGAPASPSPPAPQLQPAQSAMTGQQPAAMRAPELASAVAHQSVEAMPASLSRNWLRPAAVSVAFLLLASQMDDPFDAALRRRYPQGERIFWREEGIQTTVSVHMRPMGGRLLYLNGLHQASDGPDVLRVHRMIGLLPLALHSNPRTALVVGLGGGATAGWASRHVNTQVDVVELSDSVVRGAAWFAHVNEGIPGNRKVTLRVDDGRNYLMLTDRRYDVITADLIQPEHAGAGNLFSREYFALARRVLAEDGLMLQWIGHRPETSYKLILRTFMDVFPQTTLWADGHLMVGSKRPLRLDRARFEAKLADPSTREALEELGLASFDQLLKSFVAGPGDLRRFAGAGELLTDDRPLIEYHASLPKNDPPIQFKGLAGDVTPFVAP